MAQNCTSPSTPTTSPATNTQNAPVDPGAVKAKQLIAQMLQALGGDAYLHYSDIEQDGRTNSFYHGQPTGGTAPFWRFYKFPDKERIELTKQRDWIVIHNGDRGTETTFHGTKPEDDEVHRDFLLRDQYSMEKVLRTWLDAPGTTLFYNGAGFTDNHQVENVTVANAKNQQVTFSIDLFKYLPIRKSFTVRDPTYKEKDTYSDIYSEYRLVQGIQTPFVITRVKNDEMVSQRFLSKVVYNQGLSDNLFVPPTAIEAKKK
jgi:hypothetical protein